MANRESTVEALLRFYKLWISPVFGDSCRFSPSCSEYAAQAVIERGWWRGGMLA
ncbi:MAG: membrane protein insertion efficiency factor YidD, partial [Betaproteobacteria bacterium]